MARPTDCRQSFMKIVVTYENGEFFQHFGHTEQFKLYTVKDTIRLKLLKIAAKVVKSAIL